ncbi:MAG TPA: glycosyltransferase family 4 protein [Bacteroidia bacterium]|nr:glycosyltransferase family 4 protein [Bacteroidia bacterium]
MNERPLHIVHVMANNSSVPYFNWFAEKAQEEPNVQVSFVALCAERPQMIEDMDRRGSKAYWIPFRNTSRGRSMLAAVPKLVRLFRELKPDVVHAHLFDDAVPALAAARIAGVKVRVITKGDTGFHWYFAPKGIKFDRLNNRNANLIFALSQESRDFILEKEKADPRKVKIVHHGIPVAQVTHQAAEARDRLRARFGIREGDIVIGNVSRFIEWKGHRHIIAAAEMLVKENPRLRFLFAGTGDLQQEMMALVRKKNLAGNIQLTGWIERSDMPSFYGIMDIYLHAAAMEPFGFVIAEAMMNAVPVVSTSTGAARDAIESGKNGYLVSAQNAEALAEGIRYLLSVDRKKTGEAGRQTALQLFSLDRMWQDHLRLYREALNQN